MCSLYHLRTFNFAIQDKNTNGINKIHTKFYTDNNLSKLILKYKWGSQDWLRINKEESILLAIRDIIRLDINVETDWSPASSWLIENYI
jgi:hypothetical protein